MLHNINKKDFVEQPVILTEGRGVFIKKVRKHKENDRSKRWTDI